MNIEGPCVPDTIDVICNPAQPHYLGEAVTLASSTLGAECGCGLHVEATHGPPGEFGFLLVAETATSVMSVFNGTFCLTYPHGRYNGSSANVMGIPALNSLGCFDANGVLQNLAGTAGSSGGSGFDVPAALPFLSGGSDIQPGDTLAFQLWYRDRNVVPGDAANFSDVIEVTFE